MTYQCPHCQGQIEAPYVALEDGIERNTQPRIHWKKYLGESLTKAVAGHYALGRSVNTAFFLLHEELTKKGVRDPEMFRRLQIGVGARYSEITSESNKINDVRGVD